jgi:hypothetical protein
MNLNDEINTRREELFKMRFQNELKYLSKADTDDKNLLNDRIEIITNIITTLDDGTRCENIKKKGIFDDIDKYLYNKKWKHLSLYHRLVKIEEYIRENIEDENIQNTLIKEFTTHIHNKKLGTQKSVIYDPKDEKIISIPALIKDNGEYKIKI